MAAALASCRWQGYLLGKYFRNLGRNLRIGGHSWYILKPGHVIFVLRHCPQASPSLVAANSGITSVTLGKLDFELGVFRVGNCPMQFP
jgi:hypothetical protein